MKRIIKYQIGFWIVYFLDIFTSYMNGFEDEMNPIINLVANNFQEFVIWKLSGVFVFVILFLWVRKEGDKLLKYSRWSFIAFLIVNIINILNFIVGAK